jgi:hypothetical protein
MTTMAIRLLILGSSAFVRLDPIPAPRELDGPSFDPRSYSWRVLTLLKPPRWIVLTLALAACLATMRGSAAASNPWDLHCASMPVERLAPSPVAAKARRFFPWVRTAGALRDGPVYLLALSSHAAISRDGDFRDSDGYYLHRALIAVSPSYTGALTITGARLRPGPRTTLGFSTDGANHCSVASPDVNCGNRSLHYAAHLGIAHERGWRIVETELRIGRTGCFRLTAIGPGLRARIPLSVPGPDWGTPGW